MSQSALAALSLDHASGVERAPAAPSAPLRFSVPLADNDEFSLLKPKARHELTLTLRMLERVHGLRGEGDFVGATDALAASYRHLRGFSGPSLRRKYYAFIEARCNWRSLVKNYVTPSRQPEAFVEFIKGLIEQNHRSATAALHKLRDEIWPSGAEVPGYGTWMSFYAATWPDLPTPTRFPGIYPEGSQTVEMRHVRDLYRRRLHKQSPATFTPDPTLRPTREQLTLL